MGVRGGGPQSQYPDTGFYLPADSAELAGKWALVPKGVDLLVTHTPPSGACDVETWAASSHPRGCRYAHVDESTPTAPTPSLIPTVNGNTVAASLSTGTVRSERKLDHRLTL